MTPILFPLITVFGLAACATGAVRGAPPPTGVTCALDVTRSGGLVSVTARATSPNAATVNWGLSVSTASGSALIEQGGDAALQPGQTVVLSELAMTVPAGALSADLRLTVNGRTQTCLVTP